MLCSERHPETGATVESHRSVFVRNLAAGTTDEQVYVVPRSTLPR